MQVGSFGGEWLDVEVDMGDMFPECRSSSRPEGSGSTLITTLIEIAFVDVQNLRSKMALVEAFFYYYSRTETWGDVY